MLKNILIATDFSPASKAALRTAINICKGSGATLHVVHVKPKMTGRVYNVMSHLADKDMRKFFPSRLYRNHQKEILFQDSVSEAILHYAKSHRCDLIVLGSKSRSRIGDFLTGSITGEMLQSSSLPLMFVTVAGAMKRRIRKIQRILAPVDFSTLSKKALAFAIKTTKVLSADLHVIFVLDSRVPLYFVQLESLLRKTDLRIKRLVKNLASQSTLSTDRIRAQALAGNPCEEIRKYAVQNGIDLIVMGTHVRHGFAGVLVSNTALTILSKTRIPQIMVSAAGR